MPRTLPIRATTKTSDNTTMYCKHTSVNIATIHINYSTETCQPYKYEQGKAAGGRGQRSFGAIAKFFLAAASNKKPKILKIVMFWCLLHKKEFISSSRMSSNKNPGFKATCNHWVAGVNQAKYFWMKLCHLSIACYLVKFDEQLFKALSKYFLAKRCRPT